MTTEEQHVMANLSEAEPSTHRVIESKETETIRSLTPARRRRRLPSFSSLTVLVILLPVIGIGSWRLLSEPGSAQAPHPTGPKTVAVVQAVRKTLETESPLQAEF